MSNEPVAIYARYSTDRQDARSIDDQLRRCREFAAQRGYVVTAEFRDAAVSGAHLERIEMQKMLSQALQRRGSPFRAVIVDDLSRLSRDLGNTWRIVFEDLASASVRVIDATMGMASDGAGARLTFGALALVNDTFLQLVKTETHRGLEGRALAGFWTGGRVCGYRTEKEKTPQDPEHPRASVFIDEAEAVHVRWIFKRYIEGAGFKAIAIELNAKGVPAPYDRSVNKKRGKGWGDSTIRAMLLNERYTGTFTWNKRKFVRMPGKKNRKAVMRPPAEWRTLKHAHLAIVDDVTWAAVAARFKGRGVGKKGGRPLGSSQQVFHLLSGIARCGVCGASMGIMGGRGKGSLRYASLGCTAHVARGDTICANALTVSELKLNAAILGVLRERLLQPEVLARIVDRLNAELKKHINSPDPEFEGAETELRQVEAALENLTTAIAQAGWSQALGERLRAEEARKVRVVARRAALAPKRLPLHVPDPEAIAEHVRELLRILEARPEEGRELLRRHLGQVMLHPTESGGRRFYRAVGAFNIGSLIEASTKAERKKPTPQTPGGEWGVGNQSCGGRI